MSADIFFRIPVESRSNPSLSTNNTTERKFKEIDSTDLNNIVNKKMSSIVWLFIDSVMYRDVKLSNENPENNKHERIWKKGVELECVKALLIIFFLTLRSHSSAECSRTKNNKLFHFPCFVLF